jgi:hypothetical protein
MDGSLNAPPTTPKVQVLTEVMVDAWVAANGTADPGHTMSTSNPLAPREAEPTMALVNFVQYSCPASSVRCRRSRHRL